MLPSSSQPPPTIWHLCISNDVPKRSFWIAIVVGTILNLINQGDYLMLGDPVNIFKIALTYAVPYCVATYSAVTAHLSYERTSSSLESVQPGLHQHLKVFGIAAVFGLSAYAIIQLLIYMARLTGLH